MKNQDTLPRLKKIEGQVRGVIRMVEKGDYCIDIVKQISAVRRALDKVAMIILKNHIKKSVTDAMNSKDSDEKIKELIATLDNYLK